MIDTMKLAKMFLKRPFDERWDLLRIAEKVYEGRRNPCAQAMIDHRLRKPINGDDALRWAWEKPGFEHTALCSGCVAAEMLLHGQYIPPANAQKVELPQSMRHKWRPGRSQIFAFHTLKGRLKEVGQWPADNHIWREIEAFYGPAPT